MFSMTFLDVLDDVLRMIGVDELDGAVHFPSLNWVCGVYPIMLAALVSDLERSDILSNDVTCLAFLYLLSFSPVGVCWSPMPTKNRKLDNRSWLSFNWLSFSSYCFLV